jgi:hypothetical protein
MKKNKTFDKAGGFEFFNKLTSVVVSGSHVKAHIDIVKETSKLRQFSLLAKTMADDQTSGLTSEELCQKYNSEVAKIMAEGGDNTVLIGDACDILEKKYDEGIELLESFPTYLDCLDYYVTMSVGNVVVIASRPAMGKSSLARQLSYNWSAIGRHKVLVFTLEMDVEEFAIGMQSMAGEIPSEQIYKHLNHGGRFICDLWIPWDEIVNYQPNIWKTGRIATRLDGQKLVVTYSKTFDLKNQMQKGIFKYEWFKDGNLIDTNLDEIKLKWFGVEEFEYMLEKAGFNNISIEERPMMSSHGVSNVYVATK